MACCILGGGVGVSSSLLAIQPVLPISNARGTHHWIDSRLQPVYRIVYRLAEFVCRLSARSPPERITDIGAEYSEVHAILFVGHRVLVVFEYGASHSGGGGVKLTLIVVSRIVTTSKTAGAGVMLEASFPMFTRPMATSSERIPPLRFFGWLDLSVMVEKQDGCEVAVLGKGRAEGSGRR